MSDVQIAVIDQQDTQIVLAVPGVQGATGSSIPAGGTADQVLRKNSSTNYDANWTQVTSAMIANGTILDEDINNSAAIAGTKISPDFGGQTVTTTGQVNAARVNVTVNTAPTNGIYLPASNTVGISTNGTGRLFVDATGKVTVNQATDGVPSINIESDNDGRSRTILRFTDTDVATAANQPLGVIQFFGSDTSGAGAGIKSTIGAYSESANGDSYLTFSTATSALNNQERLRITSAGLVGVGTISPLAIITSKPSSAFSTSTSNFNGEGLHLDGTNATAGNGLYGAGITWSRNGTAGTKNAAIASVQTGADSDLGGLAFFTHQSTANGDPLVEALRIDSQGFVGIGTSAPSSILHCAYAGTLQATIQNTAASLTTFLSGGSSAGGVGTSTNHPLDFFTNNQFRARIDSSGRLLVGTSTAETASLGALFQIQATGGSASALIKRNDNGALPSYLYFGKSRGTTVNSTNIVQDGDSLGAIRFTGADGSTEVGSIAAQITAAVDGTPGANDMPGRLVFSTTSDGSASPTERLRINNSGAFGVAGANFGSAGQVLVSNGSSAAPSWEDVTPSAVFGWDHDNDTYGLYLPGTSIRTGALSGTVDIDVQSRLRRCVINDSGVVQYYLDADDSTLKAGNWLRIVETQALNTAYTGTHSESTNSLLRVGVPAWSAGTFTRGQRVTNGGYLWECIAASTTATPAAGTVASNLTGTDGQVMVEVPAFSVRYGYLNGVHTREVRLGCSDSLIAQGFQPHPAFIKTDGTYKDAFYIGAYQVTGTSPATTVSGANNRVSMTRATQRSASAARGTGWHILSYLELAAVQTLMVTEFRDMNTQRAIGNGAREGAVYVVNTGLSNAAGNRSQNAYTSGGASTDYISYRGLENIYGRAWQWVDGFNTYERVVYLTNDQTAFADNTSVGYNFYAQAPAGSSSYQKELFPLAHVFLPSVVTGASSTTYLGDAFWTSTGWRLAIVGGASGLGAQVGAFTLALGDDSGGAASSVSARLAYAQN